MLEFMPSEKQRKDGVSTPRSDYNLLSAKRQHRIVFAVSRSEIADEVREAKTMPAMSARVLREAECASAIAPDKTPSAKPRAFCL